MRGPRSAGATWPLWLLLAGAAAALSKPARADGLFTGKLSLTGLYYTEDDGVGAAQIAQRNATTAALGFVELRALLEGKRLWQDRLDLRIDLRLRFTGSLDFEDKFTNTSAAPTVSPLTSLGTTAQGYLGGPEYELRQAYALLRVNERWSLQAGRMYVTEADAAKIDGVRALRSFGSRFQGSLFAGAYPNPYSRSVLTDYASPCGDGVAAAQVQSGGVVATGPCQSTGALALAGGATFKYDLAGLWGSAAVTGIYASGNGSGGPVVALSNVTQATSGATQVLQAPQPGIDAPRVYLSWLNSWRPLEKLTLFSDLVVDLYGSAGPQLTRLVAQGTLRLLRDDRLSLRLGYAHMSSLAINMFLNNTLYNRLSGSTLGAAPPGVIMNNLTVLGTGRDEVHATADFRVLRQLGVYLDGRFRYRSLIGGDSNAAVYQSALFLNNQQSLAGDVTAGVRDSGSLWGVRAGLSYTALFDFLAMSHVLLVNLGRDLWKERLALDLGYNLAVTRDAGASASVTCGLAAATTNPFLLGCFGQRNGMTHELGLTATLAPWRKLFFLVDYRFVALLTDAETLNGVMQAVPTILSHSILARAEYRW